MRHSLWLEMAGDPLVIQIFLVLIFKDKMVCVQLKFVDSEVLKFYDYMLSLWTNQYICVILTAIQINFPSSQKVPLYTFQGIAFFPSAFGNHFTVFYCHRLVSPVHEFCVNGITQCIHFCVWLCFAQMSECLKFIHVVECVQFIFPTQ